MERVSLYIPCYNAQNYIARCIEGILAQSYPVDEIIVIDDGPGDASAKLAEGYPRVRLIRRKGRLGLPSARNLAFREARNGYVASFDADSLPCADWLERLMENFTVDAIAGVGGKCIEKYADALADRWRSVYMKQHWGDQRIINPYCLFGNNTVLRKSAVANIGFFDDVRYVRCYEDVDMSKRLKKAGYTIIYEPKAVVYHLRRDTLRSVLKTHWIWTFVGIGGIRIPDTLYNVCAKQYDNSFELARRICKDMEERRFYFLHIDILMFFHHLFCDLKYYFSLLWKHFLLFRL